MDEFVDWNLLYIKGQNCSKCGMKESESKGCCDDRKKVLKIDTDQKITDAGFKLPLNTPSPSLLNTSFELTSVFAPLFIEKHSISNAQHRSNGVAFYLLNCIFLI